MPEKSESDDLDKLSKRISKARNQQVDGSDKDKPRGKAMGMAYRMSYELVIAVLVGAYIGWLLDDWFGTKPLFLIVMFFFGMAAGIINVVRTSDQMAKQDAADAKTRDDDIKNNN